MMTMLTMEAGKIVHDSEWGQFTSATLDKDEEAGGCGASMDGDQEEACGGASTVGNEDDAPLMLPPPNTWIARFPVELEWQRVTGPTRGLNNLGNSCFMNATLQCLAAIPALQHLLTSLTVRDERVCVCVCPVGKLRGHGDLIFILISRNAPLPSTPFSAPSLVSLCALLARVFPPQHARRGGSCGKLCGAALSI